MRDFNGRGYTLIQPQTDASSFRIAVTVARFNDFFTRQLLQGALDTLTRHGVKEENLHVAWVPGAFELPLAARTLAESGRYDAVVALGCVIRGATPHFDYVCSQAAAGLNRAALDTGVPVAFGVITVENLEQAMERAGTKLGNKGSEAALAALEMAGLIQAIRRMHPSVGQK